MSKTQIEFFIEDIPVAQGRVKVNTQTRRAYDPQKSKDWKERVWAAGHNAKINQGFKLIPKDVPVRMKVCFYMPRPKSIPKKVIHHLKKPDLSNLVKGIEDALNGEIYHDDSQIVESHLLKYYVKENPVGVMVKIVGDGAL